MDERDLRSTLLDALGMGGWEAEGLTGAELARRLAGLYRTALDRLEALGVTAQRLACDVQELLSGEAVSLLHEQLAAAERENALLRLRLRQLEPAAGVAGVEVTEDDGDPA